MKIHCMAKIDTRESGYYMLQP